jgi:hypothetical protein
MQIKRPKKMGLEIGRRITTDNIASCEYLRKIDHKAHGDPA